MSPDRVDETFRHAARRLALVQGLARAGWVVLLGVGLLEVAIWLGLGRVWPWVLGAGVLLAVAGALATASPSRAFVAQVLDARLNRGGLLSSTAESLAGAHPRFRSILLRDAAAALEGWPPGRLVPLRAPPGLLLGASALLLLPVLLGRPASARTPEPSGPPSLLDPSVVAAGAEAEDHETPAPDALTSEDELTVAPEGEPTGDDPLAVFGEELAEVLRERLAELARESGVGGGAAAPGPADQDPALEAALEGGDAQAALDALERLADAAAAGDRAAALTLAAFAAKAGAGAGSDHDEPSGPAETEPNHDAEVRGAGGRQERLPAWLETTRRRYFQGR